MNGKSFMGRSLFLILIIFSTTTFVSAGSTDILTVVQTGHASKIQAFSFGPDNKILATGGDEGYVKLWDIETQKELKTYNTTQDGMITAMCFSPDGKIIAIGFGSGHHGGYATLLDLKTGKQSLPIAHDELPVSNIVFSRDGKHIACDKRYGITIYNLEKKKEIINHVIDNPGPLLHSSFTNIVPSGISSILASGVLFYSDTKNELSVFDAISSRQIAAVPIDSQWAGITLSPAGNRAVITQTNGAYKVWDFRTGSFSTLYQGGSNIDESWWEEAQKEYSVPGFAGLTPFACFSPDGSLFMALDSKGIRTWNVHTRQAATPIKEQCFAIKPGPGNTMLAGDVGRGVLKIWDRETGKQKARFQGIASLAGSAVMSPDQKHLLAATDQILIFDLQNTRLKDRLPHDNVKKMAFNPDGSLLVSVDPDSSVKLWDYAGKRMLNSISLSQKLGSVSSVAISRDCSYVATAHDLTDKARMWFINFTADNNFNPLGKQGVPGFINDSINVFDMKTGKRKLSIPCFAFLVTSIAISPDQTMLAAGFNPGYEDDTIIAVFDLTTGRKLKVFKNCHENDYLNPPSTISSLCFSPDSKQLASVAFSSIEIRDLKTSKVTHRFPGHKRGEETGWALEKLPTGHYDRITGLTFSSDMNFLASSGADALVKIWDLNSGSEKTTLSGHASRIDTISYSTDNKTMITNSKDGTQRLWDMASGTELVRICTDQAQNPEYVFVTPEGYFAGSHLLSGFIHYVSGTTPYDFNRFYDLFYRPDLVIKKINRENLSAFTGGVSIANSLENPSPRAKIISPYDGAKLQDRQVEIRIAIEETGGGIGDIRLFHNGKLVHSRGVYRVAKEERSGQKSDTRYIVATRGARIAAVKQKGASQSIELGNVHPMGKKVTQKHVVRLVRGTNTVSVCAFNRNNSVMSAMHTIRVQSDIPAQKPCLFVLSIGNDHFKNSDYNLEYAVKDAKDMARLLKKQAAGNFKCAKTTTLIDADKKTILETISDMSKSMVPEDVFVLFVASHGIAKDDLYYMVSSDLKLISSIELMEYAKKVPALKHVYMLDTCHSGGLDSVVSGLYDSRISVLAKSLGMHILAGATSRQQALDGYKENGLFTHFILSGFKGQADLNGDSRIKITEMTPFLQKKVPRASNGQQEPFIKNFGDDFVLTKKLKGI